MVNVDYTGKYYCKISFDAFSPFDTALVNITGCPGGGGGYTAGACLSASLSSLRSNLGTTAVGVEVSAALGVAVCFSAGLTYDHQGNVGIIITGGVGSGVPSAAICGFETKTDSPDIYKQAGLGMGVGETVSLFGTPVFAGGEYCVILSNDLKPQYDGYTTVAGASVGFPAECHGMLTYSFVFGANLYEELGFPVIWSP